MLRVTAVRNTEDEWMMGVTFYRRFTFCHDVFSESEDDQSERFDIMAVYVHGDDRLFIDHGELMVEVNHREWYVVDADFTVTRFVSEYDYRFIIDYTNLRRIGTYQFGPIIARLPAPIYADLAEAQAIVLCEILPTDVVACVFKAL